MKYKEKQEVMCNGYRGIVLKVHTGQLAGMYDVRLARGVVCVDASSMEEIDVYEEGYEDR